jgi:hypothetical protein
MTFIRIVYDCLILWNKGRIKLVVQRNLSFIYLDDLNINIKVVFNNQIWLLVGLFTHYLWRDSKELYLFCFKPIFQFIHK